MAAHELALVPTQTWTYASPSIAGRGADIGLLCESLIYYDRVLINPTNEPGFANVVGWFVERGKFKDFITLLKEGTLGIYYYRFASLPVQKDGVWGLVNINDEQSAKGPIFFDRVLRHQSLRNIVPRSTDLALLERALEGRVVEVGTEHFGAAVENARADLHNPERAAYVVQAFLNEVAPALGWRKVPNITASVRDVGPDRKNVSWNIDFESVNAHLPPAARLGVHTPISALLSANRLLQSASLGGYDLYLPSPMSELVGDKLSEASQTRAKTQATIGELVSEVDFPDVRRLVNRGQIAFRDVLALRQRSARFRHWLQDESERDRNALIAYHHEVARESRWMRAGRKSLRMFGVGLGIGLPIGATVAAPENPVLAAAVGAAAGEAARYLAELAASMNESWKPVVFGRWARSRLPNSD